jgi:GPH family glycoside/pentoside/hexuronide:cation symporter
MIPDCVEVDEFKTGIRREGMYYGVISFIQKAGAALFIAISAGLIGMIGYDGQLTMQTPETIIGLRWLFGGGVALFCVLSIIVNLFNPMSRKAHAALLNAIKAKKTGQEYSMADFEKLL